MTDAGPHDPRALARAEIEDSFDEELELELDDERIAHLLDERGDSAEAAARQRYFRELFRMQRELVKLQDWVVARKKKGRRAVRGPGRRRQGWRDQSHHAAHEPPRMPRRGTAGPERA
jgi:hypothetical protein